MADQDVKTLIVDSATKFFSKYGFHKTTMDEIARNIHKAKGVLYYYFRNKEELFNEVLRRELDYVKGELSIVVASDTDPLTKFKDYLLTRLRLLHNAINYHETLKADFFEKYHFVKDIRDEFVEFEKVNLTRIISEGKEEGYLDIKNIDKTVEILLMVSSAVEIPFYLQDKYSKYENTIEELSEMMVNSLRVQKRTV